MKKLGTKYCLNCGRPTAVFAGHLKAKQKITLGNYENYKEVKVGVGWCSIECHNLMQSDENGCYGEYNDSMELIDISL